MRYAQSKGKAPTTVAQDEYMVFSIVLNRKNLPASSGVERRNSTSGEEKYVVRDVIALDRKSIRKKMKKERERMRSARSGPMGSILLRNENIKRKNLYPPHIKMERRVINIHPLIFLKEKIRDFIFGYRRNIIF